MITKGLPFIALAIMAASFWRIGFGVEEFFRFLAGVVALWGPFATVLFLLLKRVQDRLARATLGCIGSYALTSLVYFGCAWLGAGWLLYLLQVAAVLWVVIVVARTGWRSRLREFPGLLARIDFLLLLLIALSLLVTSPVKVPFVVNPTTGQHKYQLFPDYLFHAGLSYELSRHVPPRQASIRAGTPERAYHLLPHLTTMLLGRYTGQGDLLRALVVYHLTVIEILMCLALFCIARIIAGVRWAGYISIALMYPLAIAWPKLIDNGYPFFYFTLFPHASSGLEAVELTAPQMYSGITILYGVLLALLLISGNLADDRTDPWLLLITAMLAAALERFRAQIFLALFPAFLLVMIYCWRRRRESWYLVAAGAALLMSLALYWEMKSPAYFQGMATFKLGCHRYNQSLPFINSWPLAGTLKGLLYGTLRGRVLWQLVTVPLFMLCNIIGIPLIAMTVAFMRTDGARGRFKLFSFTICWATVMSLPMALFLTTEFDRWSLGGEMLLHTRWYLFPLEGAVLCLIFIRLQAGLKWPHEVWAKGGAVMVVLLMVVVGWRFFLHEPDGPASFREMRALVPAAEVSFSSDEWQALLYIREKASPDAVIISNKYPTAYFFPFSGLAGRAAFLEAEGSTPLEKCAMTLNPEDDRLAIINTLWTTTNPAVFSSTISKTRATLLVEYAEIPLKILASASLRRWWQGPAGQVTIWQISGR